MLREEGLIANQMGKHKCLQKHRETNNIERRPGSDQPTKMTAAVKALVERQMRNNDETAMVQWGALFYSIFLDRLFSVESFRGRFIQRQIVLRSFYSATNCSRTVHPFSLNREGVSCNGKCSFVSFRKNGTIMLYCHIPYTQHQCSNALLQLWHNVWCSVTVHLSPFTSLPVCSHCQPKMPVWLALHPLHMEVSKLRSLDPLAPWQPLICKAIHPIPFLSSNR